MKTITKSFVVAAYAAATLYTNGQTNNTLEIGISPHLSPSIARDVYTNVTQLVLTLPAGTAFRIASADDPALIAEGVIPRLAFEGPSARLKSLAREVVRLRNYLLAERPDSPLAGSGNLNTPRYLKWVAESRGGGSQSAVLLIGSPLYSSTVEPSFDFAPNRVPNLVHLKLSPSATPFGCKGREGLLQGMVIHWWFPSGTMPSAELYASECQDFWDNYVQCQGARGLGRFSHDWATLTKSLFMPLPHRCSLDLALLSETQPTMRTIGVRVAATSPPPPAHKPIVPVALRPQPAPVTVPAAASTPTLAPTNPPPVGGVQCSPPAPAQAVHPSVEIPREVNRTEFSGIGILWEANSDLDLSVRTKGYTTNELFWNTPTKSGSARTNNIGTYLRDYRSGSREIELIELPGQPSEDALVNLEVWVDHFRGGGPVEFTAVILNKGKVIASRIYGISGDGDARTDEWRRQLSRSWVQLDIAGMLRRVQPAP